MLFSGAGGPLARPLRWLLKRNLGKLLRSRWRNRINVVPTNRPLLLGHIFKDISFSSTTTIGRQILTTMGENIPQVANSMAKASGKGEKKLWTHADPGTTKMAEFMRCVNKKYGLKLKSYDDLYRWSIGDIASFWGEVWDFTGITASKHYDEVRQRLVT
jgi:hypothetical protein